MSLGARAKRRGDAHTLSSELRDHGEFEGGGVVNICTCFDSVFKQNPVTNVNSVVMVFFLFLSYVAFLVTKEKPHPGDKL